MGRFQEFNEEVDEFKKQHPEVEVSQFLLACEDCLCLEEKDLKSMSVQEKFEHTEECSFCQDWIKVDRLK